MYEPGLFYRGLGKNVRAGIRSALEQIKGGRPLILDPPSMEEVLKAAQDLFNVLNIDYDPSSGENEWDSDTDSDEGKSDSEGSDTSESSGGRHKNKRKKTRVVKVKTEQKGTTMPGTGALVEQVTRLSEQIRQMALAVGQGTSHGVNAGLTNMPPSFSEGGRYCWGCGKKEGVDLDHALNIKKCPQTLDLLREGLVKFAPESGRLVRMDGSPLPQANGLPGGFAAIIRREYREWKGKERDVPPHQAGKPANVFAMGLMRNEERVLQGNVFAASSEEVYSFPVQTRAQLKKGGNVPATDELQKSVRFEFEHRTEGSNTTTPGVTVRAPATPTKLTPLKGAVPSTTEVMPHRINTESGWRERERSSDSLPRYRMDCRSRGCKTRY